MESFFAYSIYDGFKLILWFGPCYKNIVDEAQIAAGFVFFDVVAILFDSSNTFITLLLTRNEFSKTLKLFILFKKSLVTLIYDRTSFTRG